jgi:quinol monooxygenase YgiN
VHVIVWRFRVKPGREAEFERVYGPAGEWERLFATDSKYRGTVLVHDAARAGSYVTIDTWASRAAYESFLAWNRAAYTALDRRCEELTEEETAIAAGESVGGEP